MSINALSMLALKVAPNAFDISTGMEHVSLRDQVIRGTLLVRDLIAAKQLNPDEELLIVGAGAAGVSAALQATAAGCKATIIDIADRPFHLQYGVTTRYAGPYMYEWPAPQFSNQQMPPQGMLSPWSYGNGWNLDDHFGLRFPFRDPVTGDELARFWTAQLKAQIHALASAPGFLRLLLNVDPKASATLIWDCVRKLKRGQSRLRQTTIKVSGDLWPEDLAEPASGAPVTITSRPRFLIIATGFGPERTTWTSSSGKQFTGAAFWKADKLGEPLCGFSKPPTMAVLGGGDGALQDALRCLFVGNTPLDVLNAISKLPPVQAALASVAADILSIEQQHASVHVWSNPDQNLSEPNAHHAAFQAVVDTLASNQDVRSALYGALRQDVQEVYLIVREGYLGKAYSMNRFFIMLLASCQKRQPPPTDKAQLQLMLDTGVHDIMKRPGLRGSYAINVMRNGAYIRIDADHLSIRYGVDMAASPGQMLGITRKDTANRNELRTILQPLWPLLPTTLSANGKLLAEAAKQNKAAWKAKPHRPRPPARSIKL